MADPLRNNRPLTTTVYPDPAAGSSATSPRPNEDTAGLLPEHATDQPLGEWPRESRRVLRGTRARRREGRGTFDAMKQKVGPVADFMQSRAAELRRRFQVIQGRVKSGELREEMRDRASNLAGNATNRARKVRSRAEYYARNYPLHFIAGCAAAGFVIGFLLRMGRDE